MELREGNRVTDPCFPKGLKNESWEHGKGDKEK